MLIRKSVDNPCSMIAINEVDSHLSSSDIVCNTIIKNTKSTNFPVIAPPHSSVNSKDYSAPIKSPIKSKRSPISVNIKTGKTLDIINTEDMMRIEGASSSSTIPYLSSNSHFKPIFKDYQNLSVLIVPDAQHSVDSDENLNHQVSSALSVPRNQAYRPLLIPRRQQDPSHQ